MFFTKNYLPRRIREESKNAYQSFVLTYFSYSVIMNRRQDLNRVRTGGYAIISMRGGGSYGIHNMFYDYIITFSDFHKKITPTDQS